MFLSHPLAHNCFTPTGWRGKVWVFTFLSSVTPADPIFSLTILPGLPLSTHYDEHYLLAYSNRFIHPPVLGATSGGMWEFVGLCYDQTHCLADLHQRPSLHTGSFPITLFPSGSSLFGGRGSEICPSSATAPACLPQPSALSSFHKRSLSVILLVLPQNSPAATPGPHLGLAGFCGNRKKLLLRFFNTGIADWCRCHVQCKIFSPVWTGNNQVFPVLLYIFCSPHPLPSPNHVSSREREVDRLRKCGESGSRCFYHFLLLCCDTMTHLIPMSPWNSHLKKWGGGRSLLRMSQQNMLTSKLSFWRDQNRKFLLCQYCWTKGQFQRLSSILRKSTRI